MRIIGIGDNVVDYYLDRNELYPGGNALNVAVLAKRYGADESAYIGILGSDLAGDHILESLHAENIDVSQVRRGYGHTWESIISLNEEWDRIFIGSNRKTCVQSTLKLNFNEETLEFIQRYDVLHTSVYSSIEKDLPELSKKATLSFDFSTNTEVGYLKEVCPYVTYGFFSGSDLTHEECLQLIDKATKFGTDIVGVTRGSKGALFSHKGVLYEQPIVEANVIDTLGAGDSFISMFLVSYHQSHDLKQALRKAAGAAAATCSIYGAFGRGILKSVPANECKT